MYSPHGDHHVAAISILPAAPLQPRGPGRRSIPADLPACDPDVAAELAAWASRAVTFGATLTTPALLAWWPGMQQTYA